MKQVIPLHLRFIELLRVSIILYLYFRVRKQVVNIPSYIVRLDSQKHIDFSLRSPYGGGRPGNQLFNDLISWGNF